MNEGVSVCRIVENYMRGEYYYNCMYFCIFIYKYKMYGGIGGRIHLIPSMKSSNIGVFVVYKVFIPS